MTSTLDVACTKIATLPIRKRCSHNFNSFCIAARCVVPPQQRCAAARSTVPSRKSATDAAIQLLSPVLGSVAVVAVAVLGLEVLVTVVLVVVFVLGNVAVKLQVVGFGPDPAEARRTESLAPAAMQGKEGTLCGLHTASLLQIIV